MESLGVAFALAFLWSCCMRYFVFLMVLFLLLMALFVAYELGYLLGMYAMVNLYEAGL